MKLCRKTQTAIRQRVACEADVFLILLWLFLKLFDTEIEINFVETHSRIHRSHILTLNEWTIRNHWTWRIRKNKSFGKNKKLPFCQN